MALFTVDTRPSPIDWECNSDIRQRTLQNVKNLIILDGENACRKAGSPRALNMIMLGVAVSTGLFDITSADIISAMKRTVKPQFFEMNEKAVAMGYEIGTSELK